MPLAPDPIEPVPGPAAAEHCGEKSTRRLVRPAFAIVGVALAAVLVWLSFRDVGIGAALDAVRRVNPSLLLVGVLAYAAALVARGMRWHMLLSRAGALCWRTTIEGLVVGFATNFALPGRLGELYRADYMNTVTGISRSTVLGTIFVERAFDGLALAGMLALASVSLNANDAGGSVPDRFIVTAFLLFAAAAGAALAMRQLEAIPLPFVGPIFQRFKSGLRSVDRHNFAAFLAFMFVIWGLELGALAALIASLGIAPGLLGVTLVQSVSSLSTLLPTAPAFIGSYQFAFVLSFEALGWPKSVALAASILVQLVFFLPTMIVGFALAVGAYGRRIVSRRSS